MTDVNIPTEDSDAWLWYPAHRWVYDKIAIAQSQGIEAGPARRDAAALSRVLQADHQPQGHGRGQPRAARRRPIRGACAPGHMWMTLLEGRHVCSDVAVVDGEPRWWRHVTGNPAGEGTFDYWTVHAAHEPEIENYCGAWIRKHLAGYTGILNLETIGGRMIEVHLRMSDQWPDLYGAGWVDAVVRLYERGIWDFADEIAATDTAWCCSGRTVPAIAIRLRPHRSVARAGRIQRADHLPRG